MGREDLYNYIQRCIRAQLSTLHPCFIHLDTDLGIHLGTHLGIHPWTFIVLGVSQATTVANPSFIQLNSD
jgi:hypothetical protein